MTYLRMWLRLAAVLLVVSGLLVSAALALAAWVPALGEIAFISDRDGDRDLYVMDLSHGIIRNLTHNTADDFNPVWLPDGSGIVYISNMDGRFALYRIDALGGTPVPLMSPLPFLRRFALSPDGTRIAYPRFQPPPVDEEGRPVRGEVGTYDISVMDIAGDSSPVNVSSGSVNDGFPVWLPGDGGLMYAAAGVGGAAWTFMKVTWDADGTPTRQTVASVPVNISSVDWSQDGSRLVYTAVLNGNEEIEVLDVADGSSRRLTYSRGTDRQGVISPDGSWIVFMSHRDGSDDLYLMGAGGGGLRQLTHDRSQDYSPAWRPPVK